LSSGASVTVNYSLADAFGALCSAGDGYNYYEPSSGAPLDLLTIDGLETVVDDLVCEPAVSVSCEPAPSEGISVRLHVVQPHSD
jgi:hypothetical protein